LTQCHISSYFAYFLISGKLLRNAKNDFRYGLSHFFEEMRLKRFSLTINTLQMEKTGKKPQIANSA